MVIVKPCSSTFLHAAFVSFFVNVAQVGLESSLLGKVQGCITGICSFASVVSPLIFSPLTALFLSEHAPFHFPGFGLACAALALMVAFIESFMISSAHPVTICSLNNSDSAEP